MNRIPNAPARMRIKVLVDGVRVAASAIADVLRSQTFGAAANGSFSLCTGASAEGIVEIMMWRRVSPAEIQRMLDALAAHRFRFAHDGSPAGNRVVEVLAEIRTGSVSEVSDVRKFIGKGSPVETAIMTAT